MGKKDVRSENTLALQTDEDGNLLFDQIIKQGKSEDKIIYSKFIDTIEQDIDEDEDLSKPNEEELQKTMEKTVLGIKDKCELKIKSIKTVDGLNKKTEEESLYIRYTPRETQLKETKLKGTTERIIKIIESAVDPLEPSQFKSKKMPKGPGSPPVPVLHSPTKKLKQEEIENWKIPPSISNWKNPKGYTIALHQRIAADGRGLQQVQVSDSFAKFSESLYAAERIARDNIDKRTKLEVLVKEKQKQEREKKLRELAQDARKIRKGGDKEEEEEEKDNLSDKDDEEEEEEEEEDRNREEYIENKRKDKEQLERKIKRKKKG